MQLILPILTILAMQAREVAPMREGSIVLDGLGTLVVSEEDNIPPMFAIEQTDGDGDDLFILLPSKRLAEMEHLASEHPDARFRVTGDIFVYAKGNFLLPREVAMIEQAAERAHPTAPPLDPDLDPATDEGATEDSIADIVAELEAATGALARSIRDAADEPIGAPEFMREGTRLISRRTRLVRNDAGAWIAVFTADANGLLDPPVTILPGKAMTSLTRYAAMVGPTRPILLSGEIVTYHGHPFLVLQSWRHVHLTDHLDR
ncbi:MAG: hypothetical protein QGH76_08985 [Phycisphaerales bacterium]|nr:hypothetical protein [Phycisphaerales bacterium]